MVVDKLQGFHKQSRFASKSIEELTDNERTLLAFDYFDHQQEATKKALEAEHSAKIVELETKFDKALREATEASGSKKPAALKRLRDVMDDPTFFNGQSFGELLQKGDKFQLKFMGWHKDAAKDAEAIATKAPGTMTMGNITGGYVPQPFLTEYDMRVVRPLSVLNYCNIVGLTGDTVQIPTIGDIEGGAAQTAEGGAKPEMDFGISNGFIATKETAVYASATDKMLRVVPQIENLISTILYDDLIRKFEEQVLTGDNTGQNLIGITQTASLFAPSVTFANQVTTPNILDVLVASISQQQDNNQPMPTHIFINSADWFFLQTIKRSATDGEYINKIGAVVDNMSFNGVSIVPNNLIAKDNYLLGYMPYVNIYQSITATMERGWVNNQFRENKSSFKMFMDGNVVIYPNRRNAFIKGTFTAGKTAILKP